MVYKYKGTKNIPLLQLLKQLSYIELTLIESTHTLDSSPAASIDRLKLTYKHGCVIISPKKKKDFVNHILSINSKVHIKINWRYIKKVLLSGKTF